MGLREELLDLDAAANHISSIINAVDLMSAGLDRDDSPYAGGFFAVCRCLVQADQALREQVQKCLNAL
ncbi:hypothetical protein N510_003583 [Firmicutes bacterium ASF500]|nr:hypothetical protein N510_003583 [Firmicutes bacterium ASF500]